MKVHVDTDFAGDTDDACAVGFLMGWPDVELTGATTVADTDGWRAGYLQYFFGLGRRQVPIAAGAARSGTTGEAMGAVPDHATYWGHAAVDARPGPEEAAVELLVASIDAGATVVAIGPYTNLALLDAARPGLLDGANVVVMGGWLRPPRPGLPPWGADMDWNVQCDTAAAETVWRKSGALTLVTLPATLDAPLRRRDLARLGASGVIGQLLARQADAYERENDMGAIGRSCADVPDDLLNFQYDVVAGAVAVGAPVAVLEDLRVAPCFDGGVLRFQERPNGRAVSVAVRVDGDRLNEIWLSSIERADADAARL